MAFNLHKYPLFDVVAEYFGTENTNCWNKGPINWLLLNVLLCRILKAESVSVNFNILPSAGGRIFPLTGPGYGDIIVYDNETPAPQEHYLSVLINENTYKSDNG